MQSVFAFAVNGRVDELGLASIRTLGRQLCVGCMRGSASSLRGRCNLADDLVWKRIRGIFAVARPRHLVDLSESSPLLFLLLKLLSLVSLSDFVMQQLLGLRL